MHKYSLASTGMLMIVFLLFFRAVATSWKNKGIFLLREKVQGENWKDHSPSLIWDVFSMNFLKFYCMNSGFTDSNGNGVNQERQYII